MRSWVPRDERLAALREELAWALTTAATDLDFARRFGADVPVVDQPPEAFLNRWIEVSPDLSVLVGPVSAGWTLTCRSSPWTRPPG